MAERPLEGKLAIVTGGGTGIGRATAMRFAEDGAAAVALLGRRPEPLREVEREVTARGARAFVCPVDLTAAGEARRAVRESAASLGGLDILVNNAGIYEPGTAVATDEETWDRILDTNLKSAFLCSKEAMNHLIPRGGGSIVNIGSYLGLVGTAQSAAYCASKGGLVLLTKAMALDHARQGVRINCVCPGGVDTPMMRVSEPRPADLQRWAEEHPVGRVGTPDEVASLVAYVCSGASTWMTGAAIPLDGGISAGW